MARSGKPKQNSISSLLPALVHEKGWAKQLDLHSIFVGWRDLAGDELERYAQPLKIERGVLWLEVENSSWLQQFQYQKLELLEKLNNSLRTDRIKDIKMVLRKGNAPGSAVNKTAEVSFIRPSKEAITAFQKQIECIVDEQCREALMQFWYLAQACKRKKE